MYIKMRLKWTIKLNSSRILKIWQKIDIYVIIVLPSVIIANNQWFSSSFRNF